MGKWRVVAIGVWMAGVLTVTSAYAGGATDSQQLPPNVIVDRLLQPAVRQLLEKSPTFRRQCDIIGRARYVRVQVSLVGRWPHPYSRARSTVQRFEFGLMAVHVEMPPSGDYLELLAHEFEHVTEQIEGIDLAMLARASSGAASTGFGGVYETKRARAAGLAAVHEVSGAVNPAVAPLGGATALATWHPPSGQSARGEAPGGAPLKPQ